MQKAFKINGEQVVISVLGAPIETLFERFYTEYLAGHLLPWEDVAAAVPAYFDQNPTAPAAHDAYFNNFISLWHKLLQRGSLIDAEHVWEKALEPVLQWEQAVAGRRVHKGTPYYFWAMSVIIRRDMDRGYLIIHKAVEEDIITHGQPTPDTAGFALVSLNHDKTDQASKHGWSPRQDTSKNALMITTRSTIAPSRSPSLKRSSSRIPRHSTSSFCSPTRSRES